MARPKLVYVISRRYQEQHGGVVNAHMVEEHFDCLEVAPTATKARKAVQRLRRTHPDWEIVSHGFERSEYVRMPAPC